MMLSRVQGSISAVWVGMTWVACAVAGHASIPVVLASAGLGVCHGAVATALSRRLQGFVADEWRGVDALGSVLSWCLLSLLILAIALLPWVGGLVAVLAVLSWRRGPKSVYRGGDDVRRRWHRGTYWVAIGGALFALFVAFPAIRASGAGYSAYDSAIWIDASFHASYVSALARALTGIPYADIHGQGLPTQIYHHGSYAVAAAFKAATDVPALVLTQIYTMWGGLWLALSLYALASCFTARALVAATATMSVLLVPDVGMLPWGHGLFGFHWLLQVASASSAALALGLCALAVLIQSCTTANWRLLAFAWVLTITVAMFKAQLFVVIAVPAFLYPTLMWPSLSTQQRLLIGALQLLIVMVVTWVASFSASMPLIRYDFSAGSAWLRALAADAPGWMQGYMLRASSRSQANAAAGMIVICSAWLFSLWAVLGALACGLKRGWQDAARPSVLSVRVLLAFAASYVFTVVGLAADNRMATGGPLEVHIQGQVWGYAVFALAAALSVTNRFLRRPAVAMMAIGTSFVLFCVLSPLSTPIQRATRIAAPSLRGAPQAAELQAIRSVTSACDVVFVADGDQYLVWQAGLERTSWVVDYALNPRHRSEVASRLAQWRDASENIEAWLSSRGVAWYVMPRTTEAPMRKAPNRSPDLVQPSFDAWRISATPAPCG